MRVNLVFFRKDDVFMATILPDKSVITENTTRLTEIYRQRNLRAAKLAAQKELVAIAAAIDAAVIKGEFSINYRLTSAITSLTGEYKEAAIEVIQAEITSADYRAEGIYAGNNVVGYALSWEAEVEPENPGEDPENPGENPGENPENPGEGGETPTENGENGGSENEGNNGSEENGENGGSESNTEGGETEGNTEGGENENGTEGGENNTEGGEENGSEGGEEGGETPPVEEPTPRVPELVEDPTEDGVFTLRQLTSEDFVNGLDVLPDGVESLDDILTRAEPYDESTPFYTMHDLPFRSELQYFVRELAE